VASQTPDAVLGIAASLGIPVAEAYRDDVAANYERLLRQAALVMAYPLPESRDSPQEFEP
jgi:hypothetical protein